MNDTEENLEQQLLNDHNKDREEGGDLTWLL